MDYENERILKLIFPNGVPADVQLDDPVALQTYMHKLGTCKVDQLKHEQLHLADEHRAIVEQTQDLAISNYTTFIRTADCSKHIFREFSATEQQLDTLIERLPDLNAKCERFVAASAQITAARRLNTLTLRRNAQLLEILELPQLMDTCIRHGKYEEALELAAYVQRLGDRHSAAIPVIHSIVTAIEASWHTMLQQLLGQLRADLQLPKCLQVVGYLRRMQAFRPAELRLIFLQCRDAWLTRILAAIPSDDRLHHLTKTIELTRVNLFTIITQYKATFADDVSNDETGRSPDAPSTDDDCGADGRLVFSAWLTAKIDDFLRTLEQDLRQDDEAAATSGRIDTINTVLGQCMYFGLSFSRVGLDFRALMAPIFVDVAAAKFRAAVQRASMQFDADMERFTLINRPAGHSAGQRTADAEETPVSPPLPPETLLEYTPLALLCNGLLVALNELRPCAPLALARTVTEMLQQALVAAGQALQTLHRHEQQAFGDRERAHFGRLVVCLCDDLVPFVQRCIADVFPAAALQTHFGWSAVQLQREALTTLRPEAIGRSLQALVAPNAIATALLPNEMAKMNV